MKKYLTPTNWSEWRTYLEILLGRRKEESQRATMIRGSGGTFALKIGAVIVGLALSVSLTRILGSHGYGIYAYATAWVNVLALIATLGMHGVMVRQMAIYQAQENKALLKGMNRFSVLIALAASAAILAVGYLGTWIWRNHIEEELLHALWVALLIVPSLALIRMRQSAMMGLQHAVKGQAPEMVLRHAFLLLLVWLVYLILQPDFTPNHILGLQILSTIAALILASRWLGRAMRETGAHRGETHYAARPWLLSALPLLFVQCMQVINNKADIFMLGVLDTMQSVGIYSVAAQIATLITFFLMAVNATLAPVVARLYNERDMARLQNVITKSARLVLALSLPIALFLMFFGEWILVVFGPDFADGERALSILSGGQLINIAMGSVGIILAMTGHEKILAKTFGIAAVVNLTLNALLIPPWGIEGAAVATATSMILWNVSLMLLIRSKIGLSTSALLTIKQTARY